MPQSKKRGGAKQHRKKVHQRNNEIKRMQNAAQLLFNEAMKQGVEELKKKYEAESGQTENQETTNG